MEALDGRAGPAVEDGTHFAGDFAGRMRRLAASGPRPAGAVATLAARLKAVRREETLKFACAWVPPGHPYDEAILREAAAAEAALDLLDTMAGEVIPTSPLAERPVLKTLALMLDPEHAGTRAMAAVLAAK